MSSLKFRVSKCRVSICRVTAVFFHLTDNEIHFLDHEAIFKGTQSHFFIEESQQSWLMHLCRKIPVSNSLVEVSQIDSETVILNTKEGTVDPRSFRISICPENFLTARNRGGTVKNYA